MPPKRYEEVVSDDDDAAQEAYDRNARNHEKKMVQNMDKLYKHRYITAFHFVVVEKLASKNKNARDFEIAEVITARVLLDRISTDTSNSFLDRHLVYWMPLKGVLLSPDATREVALGIAKFLNDLRKAHPPDQARLLDLAVSYLVPAIDVSSRTATYPEVEFAGGHIVTEPDNKELLPAIAVWLSRNFEYASFTDFWYVHWPKTWGQHQKAQEGRHWEIQRSNFDYAHNPFGKAGHHANHYQWHYMHNEHIEPDAEEAVGASRIGAKKFKMPWSRNFVNTRHRMMSFMTPAVLEADRVNHAGVLNMPHRRAFVVTPRTQKDIEEMTKILDHVIAENARTLQNLSARYAGQFGKIAGVNDAVNEAGARHAALVAAQPAILPPGAAGSRRVREDNQILTFGSTIRFFWTDAEVRRAVLEEFVGTAVFFLKGLGLGRDWDDLFADRRAFDDWVARETSQQRGNSLGIAGLARAQAEITLRLANTEGFLDAAKVLAFGVIYVQCDMGKQPITMAANASHRQAGILKHFENVWEEIIVALMNGMNVRPQYAIARHLEPEEAIGVRFPGPTARGHATYAQALLEAANDPDEVTEAVSRARALQRRASPLDRLGASMAVAEQFASPQEIAQVRHTLANIPSTALDRTHARMREQGAEVMLAMLLSKRNARIEELEKEREEMRRQIRDLQDENAGLLAEQQYWTGHNRRRVAGDKDLEYIAVPRLISNIIDLSNPSDANIQHELNSIAALNAYHATRPPGESIVVSAKTLEHIYRARSRIFLGVVEGQSPLSAYDDIAAELMNQQEDAAATTGIYVPVMPTMLTPQRDPRMFNESDDDSVPMPGTFAGAPPDEAGGLQEAMDLSTPPPEPARLYEINDDLALAHANDLLGIDFAN